MKLDKYPPGLLEALNLKQNGVMPYAFNDAVSAVVESFDFYASDRLASAQAAAATVQGFNAIITDVISSQQLLRSVGFQFVQGAAAGTFMHVAIGLQVISTTITAWITAVSFGAIAAGATRSWGFALPKPIFVPPGSSVVAFFTSDAAGADHSFRQNRLVTGLVP
jgi:hypothetical protein